MSGLEGIAKRGADSRAGDTGKLILCPACGKPCGAVDLRYLKACFGCACPCCLDACGGTCPELKASLAEACARCGVTLGDHGIATEGGPWCKDGGAFEGGSDAA